MLIVACSLLVLYYLNHPNISIIGLLYYKFAFVLLSLTETICTAYFSKGLLGEFGDLWNILKFRRLVVGLKVVVIQNLMVILLSILLSYISFTDLPQNR